MSIGYFSNTKYRSKGGVKMKGNKKILVVAILLLLIAVSYSTYAIYKTSVSGTATIKAALWEVEFLDGSSEITDSFDLTFGATECHNNAHVKDGVIAPGASCSKEIVLDTGASEVDVTYQVTAGIVLVNNTTMDANANPITATVSPANGTITYSSEGTARTPTITVTVSWAGTDLDTNPNAADTTIGQNEYDITVPLTLVAKQVTGA